MRKSIPWLIGAQIAGIALQFASSVVFARYLTPHEMGIFAVATALVSLLAMVQQISLPAMIVRETHITQDFERTAFTVNAALIMLLSAAIVVMSYAGAAVMREPGVRNVLLVLAITPLFGILSFLPGAHMEREGRFKRLALFGIVSTIVTTSVGIGCVVAGVGYMSIAYAQLVGTAVLTTLLVVFGRHHARYGLGFSSIRRVIAFGAQMLAITGVHTAGARFSELLIGRLLGLSSLGIYNRASGLNNLVWVNFNSVAGRVLLVDFAAIRRRGEPLRDRYLWTTAVITATIWPALAGLAVIAKPFIVIIYGERWVAAAAPLAILSVSSMLLASIAMTWELFTVMDRLRDQTRIESIRVGVGVVSIAIGCLISLEAAAASRLIDAIVAIRLYRPHLYQMTGTTSSDFRSMYRQSFLLTLLAIAPASVLMLLTKMNTTSVPVLLAAICLGVLLWGAGLIYLHHPLASELKRVAAALTAKLGPKRVSSNVL